MKENIGIVGHGFVGRALEEGMKHAFDVHIFDTKYPLPGMYDGFTTGNSIITPSIEVLAERCHVIFVCVPTPMNADGSVNTLIVESVVNDIAQCDRENVVVIKSTVPPGTTKRLCSQLLKDLVFNPEFLTEANYIEDFKNQTRIIIGGDEPAKSVVKQIYQKAYPKVPTIKTNATIAEMVKYITNSFLATKVSFANEMYQVCQGLGIDYDKVIEYARYDDRLGESHWAVPGPDGQVGFGLSCFPKDLNGLMSVARELSVDPKVMTAVWEKNLEVRDFRDWEKMAKAVTNVIDVSMTYYWARTPGKFVEKLTGKEVGIGKALFDGSVREWYETLVEIIYDVAHGGVRTRGLHYDRAEKLSTITLRVSADVQTILECSVHFKPCMPSDNPTDSLNKQIGTLNNRMVIIRDEVTGKRNEVIVDVTDANEMRRRGKVVVLDLNVI